eukprot:4501082-Pleurochrysis_carterae.AAC.1
MLAVPSAAGTYPLLLLAYAMVGLAAGFCCFGAMRCACSRRGCAGTVRIARPMPTPSTPVVRRSWT